MVSSIERDDLHREILRTQGRLTSQIGYDALGRKAWQFASSLPADRLSSLHNPGIVVADLIERRDNPIHRHYRYDAGGELVALRDKLRGDTHYAYDRTGRLLGRSAPDLAAREHFAYDAENHLIHAATYRDGNLVSQGRYHYDSLGRRIAKVVEQDGKTKRKDFLWQGLRLLQERSGEQSSLYIYEPDSYAPLARIDGSGDDARLYYFHTDQIGTPLDVTDEDGQMVWQASYKAWGEVETYHTQTIEQNLRFQGQYFDDETGLHYNTFRYYDPGVGRFVTQDPIGLDGSLNLYQYVPNPNLWIDPWGWECWSTARKNYWKAEAKAPTQAYSPANIARMTQGKAPRMTVEVINRKTGLPQTKDVSMELHHRDIPQRIGGDGVHETQNLDALTPWNHEAVDPFRSTGYDLSKIIKGLDTW